MKAKHIFKIFTIMMMLVLTIFTTGCESQKEKYTKASYDYINYYEKVDEEIKVLWDKIAINEERKQNVKETIELCEKAVKICENYEKDTKEKLEKMEKIAKGNPELERDVRLKRKENDKRVKGAKGLKAMFESDMKALKKQK
ncbi:MAG: hypothetical protein IJ694_02500 [Acidaminococcaceae bacterium]|nr:hypothetical protein [Acidaminococcaceae bacterium]